MAKQPKATSEGPTAAAAPSDPPADQAASSVAPPPDTAPAEGAAAPGVGPDDAPPLPDPPPGPDAPDPDDVAPALDTEDDPVAMVTRGRSRTGYPGATRTIAYATQGVRAALDGGISEIMGGEWITDSGRVAQLAGDPRFLLVPVRDADHAAVIVEGHRLDVLQLAATAKRLGFHLVPDGARVSVPWDADPRRVLHQRG